MSNKTSALLKTILIAALFCSASLLLPLAHAQPSEADRRALAQLRAKAEKGDAPSQNYLGEAFGLGKLNVATNWGEAVKWWRKAAEGSGGGGEVVPESCRTELRFGAIQPGPLLRQWRKRGER